MTIIAAKDLIVGNEIQMTEGGDAGRIVAVGKTIRGGVFGEDQKACAAEVTLQALGDWSPAWGVKKGDTYTTMFTWQE